MSRRRRNRSRTFRALELAVLGIIMTVAALAIERRLAGRLPGRGALSAG
jgi:hypothetical protein